MSMVKVMIEWKIGLRFSIIFLSDDFEELNRTKMRLWLEKAILLGG